MIRYREWLAKNRDRLNEDGALPVTDPAMQIQSLQQQMNDPRTPPQAKQQLQAQITALQQQGGVQPPMQNGRPGTPANPAANPATNSTAFNNKPQPSQAYKWVNGRPVPVAMNQA